MIFFQGHMQVIQAAIDKLDSVFETLFVYSLTLKIGTHLNLVRH